jgi:hypothetical protein
MRNTKAALLVGCFLTSCFSSGSVNAQSRPTAQQMFEGCSAAAYELPALSIEMASQSGICAGIISTVLALHQSDVHPDLASCPPPETTGVQAAKAYVLFLVRHPELRQSDMIVSVFQAFRASWPCTKH